MTRKIGKERTGEYIHTALSILRDNDGQLPSRQVIIEVGKKINPSQYELERFEKSGYIRWESILHFYSIDASKAGWLRKKGGVWYLTPEGEEALNLSPLQFYNSARDAYKLWKKGEDEERHVGGDKDENDIELDNSRVSTFGQTEGLARQEIRDFIKSLDPYAFQDLVAALLRGMGYYTPFIAPRGRDGGVDIIAYQDPLGTREPRIKIQVKHRNQKTAPAEIRELAGVLKDGEIGLFVSSGGFTSESIKALNIGNRHMEKIDLDAFIDLWENNYENLDEEDKSLLPLRSIMFLAPND